MSAFVCSPAHIGALALFTLRSGATWCTSPGDAQNLAEQWARENLKSVAYTYDEEDAEEDIEAEMTGFEAAEEYVTACRTEVRRARTISPLWALRMLDCLRYQSSEHPEYRESEAYQLLTQVVYLAIGSLPDDDGPWHYTGRQTALT